MITYLIINKYHQNQLEGRIRNIAGFHSDEWITDGKTGLAVEKMTNRLAIVGSSFVKIIRGSMIESADITVNEMSISRKPIGRSILRYFGGSLLGNQITGAVFAFMTRQVNWNKVDSIFLELRTYDLTCPYTRLLIYRRGIMVSEAKAQVIAARWLQILNIIKR